MQTQNDLMEDSDETVEKCIDLYSQILHLPHGTVYNMCILLARRLFMLLFLNTCSPPMSWKQSNWVV